MKKTLTLSELPQLCLGASVLGSGGGGDTSILSSFVHNIMTDSGSVNVISVEELSQNDLVVPMAYIGSPAVSLAKGPTLDLFISLIKRIVQDYPENNIIVMPAEIGGCNALTPLVAASYLRLRLLDADLIGRAFPKVSMCKPAVNFPEEPQACYLANREGDVFYTDAKDVYDLEHKAREYTVQAGGSASIATYLFKGRDYCDYVIPGSVSRALSLGLSLESNQEHDQALRLLGRGKVKMLTRETKDGFLIGKVLIETENGHLVIAFQNEYLVVSRGESVLVATPDVIVLIDQNTGHPISSESLCMGQGVDIRSYAAPLFWRQKEASLFVALDQFPLIHGQSPVRKTVL